MSNTNSSFPTVGDSVLSYVGHGACTKPSKGTAVAKQTMGRGSSPTGTKADRSNKMRESTGPKCHIVAKLYESNAATANDQMRNVRLLPSAAGSGDFWKARSRTGQRY